jgi:hypothetical protein
MGDLWSKFLRASLGLNRLQKHSAFLGLVNHGHSEGHAAETQGVALNVHNRGRRTWNW